MNAFTPTYTAPSTPKPNAPVQTPWTVYPCDQLGKSDEDRQFEAGVRWFLAVSAAA